MKQSRINALLESVVNVVVGFFISFVVNAIMLPLLGMTPSFNDNMILTGVFSVISIGRSYIIRRYFTRNHNATDTINKI